jgi:hypothetical protein
MVQSPFDEVTTVLPSDVDDDMLLEPVPVPGCTDIDVPPPVVKPDTLPPPAVTELLIPPEGGDSPGFRSTVLQLALFGLELEDVLLVPSEDDELDELLLSACAAAATTTARAAMQNADGFIATSRQAARRPEGRPVD